MDNISIDIDEDELNLDTGFEHEQDDDDDEYVEELEDVEFEEFDDDDDDYEFELPKVTNWIASDGKVMHGVEVINDDQEQEIHNNNSSNRCGFDVCSICLKAWNSNGKHRICCLPCGHIYGMSCIKKWLLQHESSRKCPQCNTSCTFKDVRRLYATRLCLSHHKEPSTTRFPFTIQGFDKFRRYISQRRVDAVRLQDDVSRRKDEVYSQRDALERRANALQQRADVLGRQVSALERRRDSLDRQAEALERRWHALGRLVDSYKASFPFVMQKYREHKSKADINNTKTKH